MYDGSTGVPTGTAEAMSNKFSRYTESELELLFIVLLVSSVLHLKSWKGDCLYFVQIHHCWMLILVSLQLRLWIMFLINIYQRYRICNCTQWTRSGTALHHYSKLTLQIAPNQCMHWLWIHYRIKSAMIRQLLLHCPTQRCLENVFLWIFNTTAL